jgi:hypothetical protein
LTNGTISILRVHIAQGIWFGKMIFCAVSLTERLRKPCPKAA